MPTYEATKRGYANMWARAQLQPARRTAATAIARRLVTNRKRYEAAAAVSPGMPWWWVAAVHSLESGASWTTHLHNGDPLTRRTTHVPTGRPVTGSPPFTWEASARDALLLKGLQHVPSWEVSRCLYEWERYNGFGYVPRGVNSPYVWSFTTLQQPGKYVADGVFDRTAVSTQCGAAAILRALIEIGVVTLDGEIDRKDAAMTELANSIQPFAGLVPNLVRTIAGPLPSIAVRALAEALGVAPAAEDVKRGLEEKPVGELVAALQKAEEIVAMLTPPEPVERPVRAEEPVTAAPTVVSAPAKTAVETQPGSLTVQPVSPEPTFLDRFIPAGWKTTAGIVVYCAANIAGSLGYLDAATAEAIGTAGAGLAGVGVIAKIERWLPLFAGFLKVKRMF